MSERICFTAYSFHYTRFLPPSATQANQVEALFCQCIMRRLERKGFSWLVVQSLHDEADVRLLFNDCRALIDVDPVRYFPPPTI